MQWCGAEKPRTANARHESGGAVDMARAIQIDGTGKVGRLPKMDFRRDGRWTEILGGIGLVATDDGELILQRLIQLYPDILPWDELEDSGAQPNGTDDGVCVVCQEAFSAETDVLLVERTKAGEGRLVIVETKLQDNDEIRRKVIGQVIEYAARLASVETAETLRQKASEYWRRRPPKFSGEFEAAMASAFGEHWEEIWNSAFLNLRKGIVRLLIVCDKLPDDLRLIVTFLPPSMLLSAIEVQPHASIARHNEITITGLHTASAKGAEQARLAEQRFFNGMRISLAQVHMTPDGLIVSEAIDRSKISTTGGGRPYEEHLKALGAESVPGRVLAMLKEKTDQTLGRIYSGKAGWLTFFWGNLKGLYAREKDGNLEMQFWPAGTVGTEVGEKARELSVDCLHGELQHDQHGAYLNFLPITKDIDIHKGEERVRKLEGLYKKLQALSQIDEPNSALTEEPGSGRDEPEINQG